MKQHDSTVSNADQQQKRLYPAFRTVFESFGLGVMEVTEDGTILSASPQIAEDLGYASNTLLNKRIFEINPHLSLISWKRLWQKLENNHSFELKTEHMTAREMLFPVKLQGVLLPEKKARRCLIGIKNLMHVDRYRNLLDLATKVSKVGGWEWDLVNDSVLLTQEVYALLGISPEELSLDNKAAFETFLEQRMLPQECESFKNRLQYAIENGTSVDFEFMLRLSDGQYKRMAINAVAERSELQAIKLYGTLQDISAFAEKNEDLYLTRFTLDHAQEMIFWETEDGRFLYSNEAVQRLLGYSPEEMKQMNIEELVYGYSEEHREQFWQELRQKRESELEIELRAKDGNPVPVYCSMSLIQFKEQYINCVFARDWRRKKARDERLRLSQFTMDHAVDMIFWVREDGSIAFVNQTAYEQFGHQRFEHWSEVLPELDIAAIWPELQRRKFWNQELTLQDEEGTAWPVEVYLNYLNFEGKDYACAFLRDISYRKQKAAELKAALEKVQELSQRLQQENTLLKEEIELHDNFQNIITQDQRYKQVLHQVEQVADTNATVLIVGETGTGKELLARSIRNLSQRKEAPMIKVNCAALPKDLIESELFGHEKGAFTGAHQQKKGRFELSDGGTIFLDEVGEMPLGLQTKLLRVLQEGEFERVGGTEPQTVDVRVIAATNRDLREMVQRGGFREDLYYRLNVFPIYNIPLRERREDIPLLMRFFVRKYAEKSGKKIDHIPQEAIDRLMKYEFPGNIRELENIVERAVILSPGNSLNILDSFNAEASRSLDGREDTFKPFEEMQRDYIIEALRRCNWRISGPKGAAKLLQLNPRTLASKMRRLGIRRKDFIDS